MYPLCMFGILIAALDGKREEGNGVISKLRSKGYADQDISIITKIKDKDSKTNSKKHCDLAIPVKTHEMDNMLSKAQVFPNLGGLLITGPVAPAIDFINAKNETENLYSENNRQDSLFALLVDIGIPHEDAFYFTEIVEQNGFILILPEFGDLSVYEILWNSGADRILVLEEDPSIVSGML